MSSSIFRVKYAENARRHDLDRYETPPECTRALLDRVRMEGTVLEPAAGSGRMAKVLEDYGYRVEASDIEPPPTHRCATPIFTEDFLERTDPVQNVVTNPPYKQKLDLAFARHAIRLVSEHPEPGKVCMLVGHNFLWGKASSQLFREVRQPSKLIVLPKRVRFYYADSERLGGQRWDHWWIVWDLGAAQQRVIHTEVILPPYEEFLVGGAEATP